MCTALPNGSKIAAISSGTSSGIGTTFASGTERYSAKLPGRARHMRLATWVRRHRIERENSWISLPVIPAAIPAPMIAPIDEPDMATGLMPSSSSASMT